MIRILTTKTTLALTSAPPQARLTLIIALKVPSMDSRRDTQHGQRFARPLSALPPHGRPSMTPMKMPIIVQGKGSLAFAPISVIAAGKVLFEGWCFFRPIPQIHGRFGRPRHAIELAINLEKFLPKLANWAITVDKSLFTQISR